MHSMGRLSLGRGERRGRSRSDIYALQWARHATSIGPVGIVGNMPARLRELLDYGAKVISASEALVRLQGGEVFGHMGHVPS